MKRSASPARNPVTHPYCRISDPSQRKGGGLERQTQADLGEFARRFGFDLSKRVLIDDGVSAWKGLNASPEHQLGQFLAEARKGLIPPGDCLLLENYDRLSRQDPWAAIGLVNELRQLGIHVGRLDRMKLLRCDSTDAGDFFEAAIEFMRGNSESAAKSMRNGARWEKKREVAREKGAVVTHRLPAWVEERDGKPELVPSRAAAVKRIFALAAGGYGYAAIVKRLTAEKVPPFGGRVPLLDEEGKQLVNKKGRPRFRAAPGGVLGAGHWTRAYVGLILQDRRCRGEFQPHKADGTPSGDPIPGYFPAVVTEDEWLAVKAAAGGRRQPRGQAGKRVELFSGLLKNARDGGSYFVATRTDGGKHSRVLINTASAEGRAPCWSFPLPTFEKAVLTCLKEIDPKTVLNGDHETDAAAALGEQLAGVESELKEASAFMDAHGFSATIGKRVSDLEARQRELTAALVEARAKAAHPLSETWGEAQGLLAAVESAADPADARLRLRAALRRLVDGIWLLVVPRGRTRLAAVQIWFVGDKRQRSYLVLHKPTKANASGRTEGHWWARSLATIATPGDLDLRDTDDATALAGVLETLDMESLQRGE